VKARLYRTAVAFGALAAAAATFGAGWKW
jgi:hypothetical protein